MTLRRFWPLARDFLVPLIMAGLAFLLLRDPLEAWLRGEDKYNQEALAEWVREARVHQTLPELVESFLQSKDRLADLQAKLASPDPKVRPSNDDVQAAKHQVDSKRDQIAVHLQSMCDPVSKVYPGRLPLFVAVHQLTVSFDDVLGEKPVIWDSGKPRQPQQYRDLAAVKIHDRGVWVQMQYQLGVYARQQLNERQAVTRWRWLSGIGVALVALAGVWFYLSLRRQRHRELRRLAAEQQANAAERLRLQEALKRQEAERRQEDAERTALELKSQLFANIGIMAGSYAHNIKNLLVRPNDLLGRCLERDGLSSEQGHMLQEVRQTLGTVTERLQQILQTVRRDPSKSERQLLDLNDLARELHQTWREMAQQKWKLDFHLELADPQGRLWIEGDYSHLQQALENLLFNARDATFEMRNHLREQARRALGDGSKTTDSPRSPESGVRSPESGRQPPDSGLRTPDSGLRTPHSALQTLNRRQALIEAAGWKGQVWLRTRREGDRVLLEVEDNGIGMSEEVRSRCTETHFSTKRDNALFAGFSAGMGLGLSFVAVILEHHQARLEITSEPLRGACFKATFPTTDGNGEGSKK